MYNLTVDPKTMDKWIPMIEGTGAWKDFVSGCPCVKRSDYPVLATLFENAEKYFAERTNAADGVGNYSPILIPMMRRVMPALIGPQVFGTQPMSGPTGLFFILRTVLQNNSVNPINRTNSTVLTLASATLFTVGGAITGSAGGEGIVRHKDGNNLLVEVTAGAFTVGDDVDNANPYVGSKTTISAQYENEAFYHIIFPTYTGPYATATGESLSTDMKEIGFKIDTQSVTAQTRKLKAKLTDEVQQDMKAIHNIDAESILTSVASDEIIVEMNQEMIGLIKSKATVSTSWDYSTADGRWEMELYQNLCAAIGRGKRSIAVRSKRGQGTFMIVSPAVLNALEASGRLKDANVDPVQKVYAGKAMGMDVFVDIYALDDTIYIGYKGNEMDAGIYFAPYIPLQIRKGFGEEDGQPRTFFHTRYGLKDNPFGAENYFHALTVANLPQ